MSSVPQLTPQAARRIYRVLLYLVLRRFTPHAWAAAAGAILIAVHPLHTENFAWVAGRKSLLNGVFTLASFLAYMRFRLRGDDRRWYAAALLAYALIVGGGLELRDHFDAPQSDVIGAKEFLLAHTQRAVDLG